MTTSISKLAYEDCYQILDKALAATSGIRVDSKTQGQAAHLRMRLNYARQLERKLSMEIYEPGDPSYGLSTYDVLVIRHPREARGKWWVYVERRSLAKHTIEELDDDEELVEVRSPIPLAKPSKDDRKAAAATSSFLRPIVKTPRG